MGREQVFEIGFGNDGDEASADEAPGCEDCRLGEVAQYDLLGRIAHQSASRHLMCPLSGLRHGQVDVVEDSREEQDRRDGQ